MIHVLATITLHPGKRDAFLDAFRQLVPLVHAEDGCNEYGPTIDVPTGIPVQGPPRPDVVTVIEKWESIDHLHAHLAAPHMAAYRETVKDLVRDTTLIVTEPA